MTTSNDEISVIDQIVDQQNIIGNQISMVISEFEKRFKKLNHYASKRVALSIVKFPLIDTVSKKLMKQDELEALELGVNIKALQTTLFNLIERENELKDDKKESENEW